MVRAICVISMLVSTVLLISASAFYDYQGNTASINREWCLTQTLTQIGNGSSENMYNYKKEINYYNELQPNRIDSVYTYVFLTNSSQWGVSSIKRNHWDAEGEYLLSSDFSAGIGLSPNQKTVRQYDATDRLTDVTYYTLLDDVWYNLTRYHYFYTNGYLSSRELSSNDFVNDYIQYFRSEYTYDTNGRLANEVRFFSNDSLYWNASSCVLLSYVSADNSNGLEMVSAIAHDDRFPNVYGCPKWGLLSEANTQLFSDTGWIDTNRTYYSYENGVDIISELSQYNDSQWKNVILVEYSYDNNGNIINRKTRDWKEISQEWSSPSQIITYAWEALTDNDDNVYPVSKLALSVSPNPFKENTNISIILPEKGISRVCIYNIKGEKIRTFPQTALNNSKGNEAISTLFWNGKDDHNRNVAAGVYFARMQYRNEVKTCKLLMLK